MENSRRVKGVEWPQRRPGSKAVDSPAGRCRWEGAYGQNGRVSETKMGRGGKGKESTLGEGDYVVRLPGTENHPFAGIGEESPGRGFPARRALSGRKGRPFEREKNLGPRVKKSGRNLRLRVKRATEISGRETG